MASKAAAENGDGNENIREYTLEDQLFEMRSKYHLKKKATEAFFENSQMEVESRRKLILDMRRENFMQRVKRNDLVRRDRSVIQYTFIDDKIHRLALQELSGEDAVAAMEKKATDSKKKLDKLNFEARKRKSQIAELRRMIRFWEKIGSNLDVNELEITCRHLDNEVDKARLRLKEAYYIRRVYREILDALRDDILQWPKRVKALDSNLQYQNSLLSDMGDILVDSQRSKVQTELNLKDVVRVTHREMHNRKMEINTLRKNATMIKKNIDRKVAPDQNLPVTATEKAKELAEFKARLKRAFRVEKNFKMILESTQSQDLRGVIEWYRSRKESLQSLMFDCGQMEAEIEECQMQMHQHQDDLQTASFENERELIQEEKEIAELEKTKAIENTALENTKQELDISNGLVMDVFNALMCLLEKLHGISVRTDSPSLIKDLDKNPVELMELCDLKIREVLKNLGISKPTPALRMRLANPAYQHYLEEEMMTKHATTKSESVESELSDVLEFDNAINSQVPDRLQMKYRAELFVRTKLKAKQKGK